MKPCPTKKRKRQAKTGDIFTKKATPRIKVAIAVSEARRKTIEQALL